MIKTQLTPIQIKGVEFLSTKRVAILGFKTGLGKSLTLLATLDKFLSIGRNIILFGTKNSIDKVWDSEIKKHTDYKSIGIALVSDCYNLYKNLDFLKNYNIVLVKYSEVIKYKKILKVICEEAITCYDECHRLKNPQAFMVKDLKEVTSKSAVKWGLSATAILNSIMDLWGISNFLDYRIFGSEWDFKSCYCVMKEEVIGRDRIGRLKKVLKIVDYKNLDKLKEIREKFIMTAEQDLNVIFSKLEYKLTEQEENAYLQAAQGILMENFKGFAQRLGDIQKACDGSRDAKGNLLLNIRSSKYEVYLKEINKIICRNESVLLFTEFYDSFDMLFNLLSEDVKNVPIFKICGKVVQMPDKYPCIVLCTAGGTESLNLKFANNVLFYSIPFSVGTFCQFVGRITRMDSEYLDKLNVFIPVNNKTIDNYKNILIEKNSSLINKLLGHDANIPKSVEVVRYELLKNLRKELLWRVKDLKK